MTDKRDYGIDAARLLSMLMVVVLHNLGQGGVLDWSLSSHRAIAYMLLENSCIVAVNVFGLISGWLAVGRPVRLRKLGSLWAQVVFWSAGIGLVGCIVSGNVALSSVIRFFLPVLSREYWYFNAFIAMQLMTWFIAPVIRRIPKSALASVSLLLAASCCSAGFLEGRGAYGIAVNDGYSALWLLTLWLCGASLRLYSDELRAIFPTWRMIIAALLIPCASLVFEVCDSHSGGNPVRWISYVSPLVAMQSLDLFVLLARARIRGTRLRGALSVLAPAAFNVYLIDTHPFIFGTLIKGHFAWINNIGALGLPLVMGASLAMFALFLALGVAFEWGRACARKALMSFN